MAIDDCVAVAEAMRCPEHGRTTPHVQQFGMAAVCSSPAAHGRALRSQEAPWRHREGTYGGHRAKPGGAFHDVQEQGEAVPGDLQAVGLRQSPGPRLSELRPCWSQYHNKS